MGFEDFESLFSGFKGRSYVVGKEVILDKLMEGLVSLDMIRVEGGES